MSAATVLTATASVVVPVAKHVDNQLGVNNAMDHFTGRVQARSNR